MDVAIAAGLVVVAILAVWAIVYALNRPSKGRTVWPIAVAVGVLMFAVSMARPTEARVETVYVDRASLNEHTLKVHLNSWPTK